MGIGGRETARGLHRSIRLRNRELVAVILFIPLFSLTVLVVLHQCYVENVLDYSDENAPSRHRSPHPLDGVRCRLLRGFDDVVDDDGVLHRDGDEARIQGDVTSAYDEFDVIEACQGVRPVLMSAHAFHRPNNYITAKDGYLVPNIVHYIHFRLMDSKTWNPLPSVLTRPMSFLNHNSYLSVHRFIRPRYIFIHGDAPPHGDWWKRTTNDVTNIYFVNASGAATHVFGKRVKSVEHRSDILRYKIIYELGGIYIDPDVLVLRSIDPLRNFSLTLGRESKEPHVIANGIILAQPGSAFFRLWISTYRTYDPDQWSLHSVFMPARLHELMPHLAHIEDGTLINPHWSELNSLFGNKHYDWSKQYTCHVWTRFKSRTVPQSPDAIKSLNSTLGQMMRFIYFGQKEFVV